MSYYGSFDAVDKRNTMLTNECVTFFQSKVIIENLFHKNGFFSFCSLEGGG